MEVISYSVIGNQLVLRHIDRVSLQIETVLDCSVYPFRETGYISISLIVFKDLRPVFGHKP